MDENFPPYFREGDFAGGISAGLDDIKALLTGDPEVQDFEGNYDDYVYDDAEGEYYAGLIVFAIGYFILGIILFNALVVTDPKYQTAEEKKKLDKGKKPYINKGGW